jgi:hypothetical protein
MVELFSNEVSTQDFILVREVNPTNYSLLVTVIGAYTSEITLEMDRPESFVQIAETNTWEARSNTSFTEVEVTAKAGMLTSETATVGEHVYGVARLSLHLIQRSDPGFGGIYGRVITGIEGNEEPVANALVIISNLVGEEVYATLSDGDGNYSARRLEPEEHTVTVVHREFYSQYEKVEVILDEMTTQDFNLVRRAEPVNYIVLSTVTGAPLEIVNVELALYGEIQEGYMPSIRFEGHRIGTTNIWETYGAESFTGFEARGNAPHGYPFRTAWEIVGDHDNIGIARVALELEELDLVPGRAGLFGRVVDENRNPIANATVIAISHDGRGEVVKTTTDEYGQYEFLSLE